MSRQESERWIAERFPKFQLILDDNEARRPLQVEAAKRWQPLLQTLLVSGVAAIMSAKTGVYEFPRLEIQPRAYSYDPPASEVPRVDEVNFFALRTQSPEAARDPRSSGWSLSLLMVDPESPNLQLEASRIPDWEITSRGYEGHHHSVRFDLDPGKNLRIVGEEETFNGNIDHLNIGGLERLKAAMDRAFQSPQVSQEPFILGTLNLA